MAISLPEDIAFTSDVRYERVGTGLKSHIPFSVAAFSVKTLSINHNLGYEPYVRAWYTFGDNKYFRLFSGNDSYGLDGNGGQIDNEHVDTSNYYITISENNGSPISGTVYYRIYEEPQA